jgi:hypothetical protein
MSMLPQNGGFHCSTGASALCAGPALASVASWPPPVEHTAVAKVSIFNVALPVRGLLSAPSNKLFGHNLCPIAMPTSKSF